MALLWWKKGKSFDIFLRDKPVELLLCLTRQNNAKYPSLLAKEARCTYSHTVHLLQKMEQEGLVRFEKNGRLKIVQLTGKGEQVANSFEDLEHLFKLIKTNNWSQDNTMDCATYLRTIDEVGVNLDIEIIIKLSAKKIKLQSLDDSEKLKLKNMINSLILFYEKAINISKNEQYKKE